MSMETRDWLSTMTLIGDTDDRGNAWHYRMGDNNHFPGAIPPEAVETLLCNNAPVEQPLYIKGLDGTFIEVPNFKGMASRANRDYLHSVHSSGYATHDFKAHLFDNATRLLGDDIHFSSAGILAKGGVAWIELAITGIMTVEGFDYRPHLLGHTSSNGRYESGFGRKIQATVCDNTLNVAYGETGQRISWRHTKGSIMRIKDAAEALGIILNEAAQFEADIQDLLMWPVTPKVFSRFLDEMIPEKDKDTGQYLTGAALTRVERRREEMAGMWNGDPRVAPWNGTALGILQLSNTWQHHKTGITKATNHRVEKNMLGAISGKTDAEDLKTLGILNGLSQAYGLTVPEKFERLPVPELVTL